ncbi:MAG: hypothetical protein DMG36_20970 [Acidobacteria bacterium]|nr:MAG: hypothetical protein DMG36_20970 [Acidobacteriota bacterium]
MLLVELDIENFKSLEKVSLKGLQQLNVLIGPNNSGKSAILGTLDYLRRVVLGQQIDTAGLVIGGDNRKQIRVRVRIKLGDKERNQVISNLAEYAKKDLRTVQITDSQFLRMIEYHFESVPRNPQIAHVVRTSTLAEDGKWVVIQQTSSDRLGSNPQATIRNILDLVRAGEPLSFEALDVITKGGHTINWTYNFGASREQPPYNVVNPFWPFEVLSEYLGSAFVFSTFRHSQPKLGVQESQIEEFVRAALPHLGELQTPLTVSETEIGFHLEKGDHDVRLQDTGGGVEQILMIAIVLVTTGSESALFLEEPESHLHPGAQRFLLERISASGRQVILTTHSPVFVNTAQPRSLYRVSYKDERTSVNHVADSDALSEVLSEIGARNSDVLMSDGVLFVEGPSDRETFMAWSDTLGKDLAALGVGLVSMGGGGQAMRAAPLQAEVMAGISKKAPVPHLFVLDRDERSSEEINRINGVLGDRVRFLKRREIENYLLVPRAVLKAIREKYEDASKPPPPESPESLDAVRDATEEIAESLFGTVLLKRIRSRLPRLAGGPFPVDRMQKLIPQAPAPSLAKLVKEQIEESFSTYAENLKLDQVVSKEQKTLQKEWKDGRRRMELAPGEEVLTALFERYGLKYNKQTDTVRIARAMREDEIPKEIKEIVGAAAELGRLATRE